MTSATAARPDAAGHAADSPGEIPTPGWRAIAIRTWRESSEDNVGLIAAGVAFYGFLALVPLLGATVLTYGLFASPETVARHAASLTSMVPAEAAGLIGDQLLNVVTTSGGKKGFGLLLALAIALWGARNAAGSLITALNIAYEEEERRSFIRVTLLSLLMTAAAVVMALLVGAATAVLSALEKLMPGAGQVGLLVWKQLAYVLLAGVAAAAAAALYRYGPSRDRPKWTWLSPGSIFFAVTWIALTVGFGFSVRNFGNYGATYGSLSAVIVMLTWLYLSSYMLMFGAEFNSEVEHQTAQDTTAGADRPIGQRGAWAADHVAGGVQGAPAETESVAPPADEQPSRQPAHTNGAGDHPYLASRATARAGQLAGLRKVGMISSVVATVGLSKLRRRGSEKTGAVLLATAAGLSLMRRRD
jgi:membrane protein